MTAGRLRGRLALTGKVLAAALVIVAASGRMPHLVLAQAVVSSLLTMVAAPLSLLDRGRAPGRQWTAPALPAIVLMSAGTIAYQAPPVVATIGEGGPLTALALVALFAVAMGFWSVVLPPARLHGLHAAGYVIAGGLPISMPAMFLIMLPRDIYTAFHAAGPTPLAAMDDQIFSGFVMFAVVKITMFVAFSFIFMSSVTERAEGGDGGDGDREARRPPNLPGWVQALLRGEPTVEEPAVLVRREPVGRAGRALPTAAGCPRRTRPCR